MITFATLPKYQANAEAALDATVRSLDSDIEQKDELIEKLRTQLDQSQTASSSLVASLQQQVHNTADQPTHVP